MTSEAPKSGKELTGKHVLMIVVSFFAVVIAVNVFMATMAVRTFPGLETKNSYVASQSFDADRAAQEALGWEVQVLIADERLMVMILDPNGAPVDLTSVGGILGRATHVKDDQRPQFKRKESGVLVADVGALDYGKWELRLEAVAADGTPYRKLLELYVPKT